MAGGSAAARRSARRGAFLVLLQAFVPRGSRALEFDAAAAFYPASDMPAGRRDTLDWALRCLSNCKSACLEDPPARSAFEQALRWDDEEDCAYRCVHACLAEGVRAGGKLYKYKGRWPHTRLLGVQEPFSTAFSLLNAAAHIAGLFIVRRSRSAAAHMLQGSADGKTQAGLVGGVLKVEVRDRVSACVTDWFATPAWQQVLLPEELAIMQHQTRMEIMSCLWIAAWTSSAIFHTRDTWLTERLDYNSGNIAMGFMSYLSVARGATLMIPLQLPSASAVMSG